MRAALVAVVALTIATTAAAAPSTADQLVAEARHHLTPHGAHWLAQETERLAGGTAFDTIEADARAACIGAGRCLHVQHLSAYDEVLTMTILAESEARRDLDRMTAEINAKPGALTPGDMIKLQKIINRHIEALEVMRPLIQKNQRALDDIVRNMR